MVLVTLNKSKQLLLLTFIGHVLPEELVRSREDLIKSLSELSPQFRLLTDLSPLEAMHQDCAKEIARSMELCDEKGVGLLVRVIPDPRKDIGLNILSAFHYSRQPRIVICNTMTEAARALSL
jgi:hypothetical protein